MSNGYRDKNNKFHPITTYKPVRKKRNKSIQPDGVKIQRKKVTPASVLKKELREEIPDASIPDAIEDIQSLQRVDERIPNEFKGITDLVDVRSIEKGEKSKVMSITKQKVDGMTVLNFKLENGSEIFIFKNLGDESKFVEDNIRDRFEKGDFDRDVFEFDRGNDPANEREPLGIGDFLKLGDNNKIHNFMSTHGSFSETITKDVSDFKENPLTWLIGHKRSIGFAVDKGVLIRETDEFIKFKNEESPEGLTGFLHPKYEMLSQLPSHKHEFKEKMK